MGDSCEKTWFQARWYKKTLLLENNKGTDQTAIMSKPAYLSVEIVTDKPTSGKMSIPQEVSVAEQAGLSLTWSQTQYLCQQSCMLSDISRVFVMSQTGYIRHNFKQIETLSKFRTLSESRLFANVFSGVTTSGDSWSKRPTIQNRPRVYYQVACVV